MAKRKARIKGKAIRWSKMKPKQGDDIYLELATPTAEIIERAKQEATPEQKPFLEAEENGES